MLDSPCCLISDHGPPRDLHSFPTRRSSDLQAATRRGRVDEGLGGEVLAVEAGGEDEALEARDAGGGADLGRSEEHTSELQSPCNLVCRLLLEKKKIKTKKPVIYAVREHVCS